MRELKVEEEKKVLKKLSFFIGDNVKYINNEDRKLYLHNKRVFIVKNELFKASSSVSREGLVIAGTVLGKFTKNENFRISITSLNLLASYAINKVWIKKSAEMNFLYGNNALKSHIYRISENVPLNGGVFVYNQNDVPLGFGVTAIKPEVFSNAKGYQIVVIRQGDNGEYIRGEHKLA